MAKVPIPKKPTLFKDYKGRYAIHFASVRSNGANTLGSLPLKTSDPKEAKRLFREKVGAGEVARLVDEARARAADGLKVGQAKKKPKRQVRASRPSVDPRMEQRARSQLAVVTAQLHALALAVEQLGSTMVGEDEA